MNLDKKEIKPITDILGYAVLDSQKLEYSIAFMMLMLNNEINLSSQEFNDKIDDYMLNLSKKTLGALIIKLSEIAEISAGFKERLEIALEARNYIIHRFLNDQAENLLTINGRKKALEILKNKREILYDCYFFLDSFIQKLMEIKGFDFQNLIANVSEKYEPER